jgi:hypothetical protein
MTPRAFSSSDNHLVVDGQSGMMNAVAQAKTTVAAPSMMNSHLAMSVRLHGCDNNSTYLQLAMRLFLKAAAIPAANKPPKAPESIAPQKKMPSRIPSSLRVYHPEKKKATPAKNGALRGVSDRRIISQQETDSVRPRKKRQVAIPVKFCTAPVAPLTIPQATMTTERYILGRKRPRAMLLGTARQCLARVLLISWNTRTDPA